jgi:competence protein ComEA
VPGIELKRNQKMALVLIAVLCAIGFIWSHYIKSDTGDGEIIFRESDAINTSAPTQADSNATVMVHVSGCVNQPGVYQFSAGKRVVDAIKAAGGARPNADLQQLNLAERLVDASKIYVPMAGESSYQAVQPDSSGETSSLPALPPVRVITSPVQSSSTERLRIPSVNLTRGSGKASASANSPVNINTANIDTLDALPGVGPATAQKILDYRNQIGRFTSVEQLMDVKGIGPKKFEKMKPFVRL